MPEPEPTYTLELTVAEARLLEYAAIARADEFARSLSQISPSDELRALWTHNLTVLRTLATRLSRLGK